MGKIFNCNLICLQILNHVNRKHTPPPKAWWIPPVGLRMAIRMMLRQMNVNVVCTIDDHRQEVIAYCRENNFHGIIADDAEYIAFDPPRLFSASQMKLTYHVNILGFVDTRNFVPERGADPKLPFWAGRGGSNVRNFCLLAEGI